MRRLAYYLLCLVVFLAGSVLSTAITFVWSDKYWEDGVGSSGQCVDAGEGLTGLGGFSIYIFYDSNRLSFARSRFESASAAAQCFQSQAEAANSILERKVLFDKSGEHAVGERVVAVFPPNEYSNKERFTVISLDGSNIFEIASHSLKRSTNFEKKIRRY